MTEQLVTVCVPTIGRGEMLEETLLSLQQQTYPHLEILLLDNASSDSDQVRLQRFAKRDSRARILRSEQRLPMFENFNRGVRAARGEYVVFFFDDDVYLPQFIERQLTMLTRYPTVGFVGSNYFIIDETSRVTDQRRLVKKTEVMSGRDYIKGLIWRGRNIIGTPGIMYRRELIASCPFDESLSVHFGDFVMLMRMAERADVALLTVPLLKIRIHALAASSSLSTSQAIQLRTRLVANYIAEYASRWPDDVSFTEALERSLARSHVVGLVSGWIRAGDEQEADACLNQLRDHSANGRSLASGLQMVGGLGLSAQRRRRLLAPLLSRLGRTLPA